MAFGMEGAPQMHWSKEALKNALLDLEKLEKPPMFFDSNKSGDTGERDAEYFAMGYKVEKAEYDKFVEEFREILKAHDKIISSENSGKVIKMNNNLEEDYNKAV